MYGTSIWPVIACAADSPLRRKGEELPAPLVLTVEDESAYRGMENGRMCGYTKPMRFLIKVRDAMNRHPTITDGVIALVLVGLALLQLRIYWELRHPENVSLALAIGLTLLVILPLTWRRRFPLTVLIVMTAFLILHRQLEIPGGGSSPETRCCWGS